MDTFTATTEIDRPADEVWAVVADYDRDPAWRRGVTTMAPSPAGPVQVGTTTAEVLRLGGRTLHNDGVVTDVDPGRSFRWRTTAGADAEGSRTVEPLDGGRCRVTLELRVQAHGVEKLLAPALRPMLRKGLVADAERLRQLVTAAPVPAA